MPRLNRTYVLTAYLMLGLMLPMAQAQNQVLSAGTGSISGRLLMWDDQTPHVACVVQAVGANERGLTVVATILSDAKGRYHLESLETGSYQVRCYVLDGYIYYQNGEAVLVQPGTESIDINFRLAPFKKGTWRNHGYLEAFGTKVRDIAQASDGTMWFGTKDGLYRYDGEMFQHFTTRDGLATNPVFAVHAALDGALWVGGNRGISRYHEGVFENFTQVEGWPGGEVCVIHQDPDGTLWFGTGFVGGGTGLYRYDGKELTRFTTQDGLPANNLTCIYRDTDGMLWLGGVIDPGHGPAWVARHDGNQFTNVEYADDKRPFQPSTIHQDADGTIWVGGYANKGGVYRYDGKELVRTLSTRDGLPRTSDMSTITSIHQDSDGTFWFGTGGYDGTVTGGGVSRYDGTGIINFTQADGLMGETVWPIHRDEEGVLWFGTENGVSRYDEHTFINFTTKDGLAHDNLRGVYQDSDGVLWLWSPGGISRYDGKRFTNLTEKDGLTHNDVRTLTPGDDGELWIGTMLGGVCRFVPSPVSPASNKSIPGLHQAIQVEPSPGRFIPSIPKAELANDHVLSSYRASDGSFWFGTAYTGAYRYDGEKLTHLGPDQGLPGPVVTDMIADPAGNLWFALGRSGVARYDGQSFVHLTEQDGLPSLFVYTMHRDRDGTMWFGGAGGLSRYDGTTFVNYSTQDGLGHNSVGNVIYRDHDGLLWVGNRGGMSGYDGQVWTSLDTRDGVGGGVTGIVQDTQGTFWLATTGGLTRYRRSHTTPSVRIVKVRTDREYGDLSLIQAITVGRWVTVEYHAIDVKTVSLKRQYRVCLLEGNRVGDSLPPDADCWQATTRESSFEHRFSAPGTYTFVVQTIDRDLNYSEPASVVLTVVNPFYLRAAFLVPTVGGGGVLIIISIILAVGYMQRRRQVHAYERYAARELQDARQMQMSLMPEHAPVVEGLEIAGRCVTANTVGGDFFDYLADDNHRVGLVVADVSGKAMRGAMNAVHTGGIVRMAAEDAEHLSPGHLMSRANTTLATSMESDMNVTMVIGLLDTQAMTLTLANAAHHAYPLLVRDGQATELKSRGLPLGMRTGVQYREENYDLHSGDILVLMTDGIIEAHDAEGNMYGDSGRMEQVLAGFTAGMTAKAMVDALIQNAIEYSGGAREDDATVVAAKIEQVT